MSFSKGLAALAKEIFAERATERSLEYARHALLDYLAVAIAGSREPVAAKLLAAVPHGGCGCTLIGLGHNAHPADAALINGAVGHALDFDDVNDRAVGHPSVVILPAVLAEAERHDHSEAALLRAIVTANEVGALIGERFGAQSYRRGAHTTGTIGTVSAAVGVALLRGADQEQLVTAISLAATQAAGLKAMFGTEAKPLNAGFAARNGLIAADLAMAGISAPEDAILARGGLVEVLSDLSNNRPLPSTDAVGTSGFAVEDMLYKYHASCYLTHATIEATKQLACEHALSVDDLVSAEIRSNPGLGGVCDIRVPQTGLNVKFSVRMMLLLALDGRNTGDLDLYSDGTAQDPRYREKLGGVALVGDDGITNKRTQVTLTLNDGRKLVGECDMSQPEVDPARQDALLKAKAQKLIVPVVGAERFRAIVQLVLAEGRDGTGANSLQTLWRNLK